MSERHIHCIKCSTYLGVIRDAKIMKGITYCCPRCSIDKKDNIFDGLNDTLTDTGILDMFGDIFGTKK